MVFLLRQPSFRSRQETTVYTNKLFIFKDIVRFSSIDDYSLLLEQVIPFLENCTMHDGIKARLEKLLTIGTNLKNFNVGDFSKYNRDDYLKKLEEGVELIYNKANINNCLMEFDTIEMTEKEFDLYEDGYREPKQISICNMSEKGFLISFPKEIEKEYERHIVLAVEQITGNFEDDIVLSLLNMFDNLSVETGIKDFSTSYSICQLNCHQEIAFALKKLFGTITYLKNCTSMRSNELFGFDEMYLHDNTEYVACMIENSVNCLR